MNAIPDPVEFKPEPEGATPAERATFEAIYRVEKLQRAQRGEFLARMRAQEEKLAGVFGDLVGELLAPRDQTTTKLVQDSEVLKRQITVCESRQADGRAVLEQRLDDLAGQRQAQQQAWDAVIDNRFDNLIHQITALENRRADACAAFATQLADAKAATEKRFMAMQADYERRLDDISGRQQPRDAVIDDRLENLIRQMTALENCHADARAEFETQLADEKAATEKRFTTMQAAYEQRLDDVSGRQQARDAVIDDRLESLTRQVVALEHRYADARAEFATQLADAKAVAEQRVTAIQAGCEQRLAAQQAAHDQAMTELRTAHADLCTKNAELDHVAVDLGERLQALTQANTVADCEQRLATQQVAHDQAMAELRTAHADLQTKNAELDNAVADLGERLQALTQANTALQAQCEARGAAFDERLAQSQRDTSAELTKAARNVDALLADNVAMRRELEQAKDVMAALRESELYHQRAAALRDEAKRGPAGLKGDKGDTGRTGRAGKDGVTTTITKTVATKRWEIDRKAYTIREVKTNGERGPAMQIRDLFVQFAHDMDM